MPKNPFFKHLLQNVLQMLCCCHIDSKICLLLLTARYTTYIPKLMDWWYTLVCTFNKQIYTHLILLVRTYLGNYFFLGRHSLMARPQETVSQYLKLLNTSEFGENPAVLFCFDFLPRPSKKHKKYHFCRKIWQ